jgi:hypothetical protein
MFGSTKGRTVGLLINPIVVLVMLLVISIVALI